jgi:hypothetical protein
VSVLDVAPVYGAVVEAFDQARADRAALRPLRAALLLAPIMKLTS